LAEDLELAAPQRNITEQRRRVVKIARVISGAAFAVTSVLENQRLRPLDSSQREVMSLNPVAIILRDLQVDARPVQNADHDDGENRHAPQEADEDGSVRVWDLGGMTGNIEHRTSNIQRRHITCDVAGRFDVRCSTPRPENLPRAPAIPHVTDVTHLTYLTFQLINGFDSAYALGAFMGSLPQKDSESPGW